MGKDSTEVMKFHAHVYYDPESRDAAACVREGLGVRFDVKLGRWHDRTVGPHPQAMYQVEFSASQFGELVRWLMLHREGLNVLVHPQTGDTVADHLERCLWLGEKLPLNVEPLRRGTE